MSICYYSCIKEDVNQSYVDALPRFILGHFSIEKLTAALYWRNVSKTAMLAATKKFLPTSFGGLSWISFKFSLVF